MAWKSNDERRTLSDATNAGVSRKFKVGHTFNGRKYERPAGPLHTYVVRKKVRCDTAFKQFEVESGKK